MATIIVITYEYLKCIFKMINGYFLICMNVEMGIWIDYKVNSLFFYCYAGGILWPLQKFLQYINMSCLNSLFSTILLYSPLSYATEEHSFVQLPQLLEASLFLANLMPI
jgi:hypothetical protein